MQLSNIQLEGIGGAVGAHLSESEYQCPPRVLMAQVPAPLTDGAALCISNAFVLHVVEGPLLTGILPALALCAEKLITMYFFFVSTYSKLLLVDNS